MLPRKRLVASISGHRVPRYPPDGAVRARGDAAAARVASDRAVIRDTASGVCGARRVGTLPSTAPGRRTEQPPMDPQRLLEQFLGSGAAGASSGSRAPSGAGLAGGGLGGMAGGLAAGGLVGLLLGSKKARKTVGKLAGGVVGYGGAAALGALGYRAWRQWQEGQQGQADAVPAPAAEAAFLPGASPAADGKPFELALVQAMIAAANADGHIGPEEQRTIFEQAGKLELDAEAKAFIFDAIATPPSLGAIAALAATPEQAAEIYLASRLAIDVDHPAEHAYLEALAGRLRLPRELVERLDAQAASME